MRRLKKGTRIRRDFKLWGETNKKRNKEWLPPRGEVFHFLNLDQNKFLALICGFSKQIQHISASRSFSAPMSGLTSAPKKQTLFSSTFSSTRTSCAHMWQHWYSDCWWWAPSPPHYESMLTDELLRNVSKPLKSWLWVITRSVSNFTDIRSILLPPFFQDSFPPLVFGHVLCCSYLFSFTDCLSSLSQSFKWFYSVSTVCWNLHRHVDGLKTGKINQHFLKTAQWAF